MKLTKAQRQTLRGMFDGRCAYCGNPLGDRWHADHVEAVERKMKWVDGRLVTTQEVHRPECDTIENLMPACPPCNIDKHTLSLENWRTMLEQRPSVLRSNYATFRSLERFGLIQETREPVVFRFEKVRAA